MQSLILMNVQKDYGSWGAFQINHSENFVNELQNHINSCLQLLVLVENHQPDHISFASSHLFRFPGMQLDKQNEETILYPMHCIQGTLGAQVSENLSFEPNAIYISRGENSQTFIDRTYYDRLCKQLNLIQGNEVMVAGFYRNYETEDLCNFLKLKGFAVITFFEEPN